jgi:hypothetical protein
MKRYNWMTPEDAAMELRLGEFVWSSYLLPYSNGLECLKLCAIYDHALEFKEAGDEESFYISRDTLKKCICRAMVPEVPSE